MQPVLDLVGRPRLATWWPCAKAGASRALIGDDADRNVISSALLRYPNATGDELADVIDMLTIDPDARRKVVRMLAEIDASK